MAYYHRRGFARILDTVVNHPSRILGWGQATAACWVLLVTLIGLGGYIFYGEPMVVVSGYLIVLGAIHALYAILKENDRPLDLYLFLPLPFLLFATYNAIMVSHAQWVGIPHVAVLWQGYGLFFLVGRSIRRQRDLLIWGGIIAIVAVIALLGACYEAYVNADWFPVPDRERSPQYINRAAGFFGVPNSFGALMLLVFPCFFLGAFHHRFPGPMRILLGFLTLASINGLFLSVSRGALLAFAIQILLMPFFMSPTLRRRVRYFCYFILTGLIGGGLTWFSNSHIRERIITAIEAGGESTRPPMWAATWEMFLDSPLLGKGVNSFYYLWEHFRPEQPRINPRYAHSDYLEFLASYGIVGAILCFGPALFLLGKAYRRWRKESYFVINPEQLAKIRRSHGPNRIPSRKHRQGHVPRAKILLGGLLLGLFGFGIHLMVDFHLQIPILLFCISIFFAMIISMLHGPKAKHPPSGILKIVFAIVPMLCFSLVYLWSAQRFYAQHFYFVGIEALDDLLTSPAAIFENPGKLYDTEAKLRKAVQLNPEHGLAWGALGNAVLNGYLTESVSERTCAERALPIVNRALQLAPEYWLHHHSLARIYAFLEYPEEDVLFEARKAVELAPMKPQTHTLLGSMLHAVNPESDEGKAHLLRALELEHNYQPAIDWMNRLNLN